MSLLKTQLRNPKYGDYSDTNFYENHKKNDDQESTNVDVVLKEPVTENVRVKYEPLTEDVRVKYEPGVILKISFANPIESDKIFKVLNNLLLLYYANDVKNLDFRVFEPPTCLLMGFVWATFIKF